jgi:hypothetical protein
MLAARGGNKLLLLMAEAPVLETADEEAAA